MRLLNAGDMVNQADNPDFKAVLSRHRAFLEEHAQRHNDRMALEMLRNLK
ncbi:MAG: hypothetical protein ACYTFW_14870 [Planctomycetota bacterium]